MSEEIKSKQITQVDDLKANIVKLTPEFQKALPPHISVEKFVRVVLTAIQLNPNLIQADRKSLFSSCVKAATDGLLPDGREAALVIYGSTVQYLPMIAGIMKKVRNSGEISKWSMQIVKEKDNFIYELGDNERIEHKPAIGERGKTIGAYSIVTLKDSEKSREFMTVEEIEAVRSRSRAKSGGPWITDYDEMCKKTVGRRHSKRLPMSTDLEQVIQRDDELYDFKSHVEKTKIAESGEGPKRLAHIIEAHIQQAQKENKEVEATRTREPGEEG